MNIHISIVCDKCLEDDYIILTKDTKTNSYVITEDVEHQSHYWCNHDEPSGFQLNCPCGNEIRIHI